MAKILVSLPKEFVYEMDQAARLERLSRSGFVREAVRHYLHRSEVREVPRRLNPVIRRAIATQKEIAQRLKGSRWESAKEIRRWRDSRRR